MSRRAVLLIILLLISAIILSLIGIFLINKNSGISAPRTGLDSSGVPIQPTSVVPAYILDDSKNTLLLTAKINEVSNKNNRITANISFDRNGTEVNKDVILFDGKVYDAFYLTQAKDKNDENAQALTFSNRDTVYTAAKKLKGENVRADFDVSGKKSSLACNKLFFNYLNGSSNNLPCIPFVLQLTAYAN